MDLMVPPMVPTSSFYEEYQNQVEESDSESDCLTLEGQDFYSNYSQETRQENEQPLPIEALSEDAARMRELMSVEMVGPGRKASKRREPNVDWHLPQHKERMDNALRSYIQHSRSGKKKQLRKWAEKHMVPYVTFRARLKQTDPFEVPVIGRPGLFDKSDRSAIVDAVLALDHLNNGKNDSVTYGTFIVCQYLIVC